MGLPGEVAVKNPLEPEPWMQLGTAAVLSVTSGQGWPTGDTGAGQITGR